MPKSITIECVLITPLFMVGADAHQPELRAPSIKGAMRFWWRAMNGHLDLKRLREKEGEIFGDTSKRSKVIIQVIEEPQAFNANESLLPHKQGSTAAAFRTGEKCQVKLSMPRELPDFKLEHLKNLFILTCLLGGFGKRSRRGMGSFEVKTIKDENDVVIPFNKTDNILQDIEKALQSFSPFFKIQYQGIFTTFTGRMESYPWIKSIQIGKKFYNEKEAMALLIKIGKTTHDVKHQDPLKYEVSLGHASKGRFASPIYTSIIETDKGLLPIITTLNTCPNRAFQDISKMMQEDFKNMILS